MCAWVCATFFCLVPFSLNLLVDYVEVDGVDGVVGGGGNGGNGDHHPLDQTKERKKKWINMLMMIDIGYIGNCHRNVYYFIPKKKTFLFERRNTIVPWPTL